MSGFTSGQFGGGSSGGSSSSGIAKLSTTTVPTNVGGAQALYTVPSGKRCVVVDVVVRDPTASLAAIQDSLVFGFNGNQANGEINNSILGNLINNTVFVRKAEFDGMAYQKVGQAGQVFDCEFLDPSINAFVTIDVFGYLV